MPAAGLLIVAVASLVGVLRFGLSERRFWQVSITFSLGTTGKKLCHPCLSAPRSTYLLPHLAPLMMSAYARMRVVHRRIAAWLTPPPSWGSRWLAWPSGSGQSAPRCPNSTFLDWCGAAARALAPPCCCCRRRRRRYLPLLLPLLLLPLPLLLLLLMRDCAVLPIYLHLLHILLLHAAIVDAAIFLSLVLCSWLGWFA